jgi:hypothetical protein
MHIRDIERLAQSIHFIEGDLERAAAYLAVADAFQEAGYAPAVEEQLRCLARDIYGNPPRPWPRLTLWADVVIALRAGCTLCSSYGGRTFRREAGVVVERMSYGRTAPIGLTRIREVVEGGLEHGFYAIEKP